MASPNEPSSSKRRLGRRRLPPLEPGPALQFVVANHPDQFRAGKTMRHVRSHVMYKHRTERKTSATDRIGTSLRRSASEYASSTPSPAMTSSDASASDIDYLIPPQSRPRSSTWTGAALEFGPYAPSPSTLRTLIHHILTSTQGVHARSAPPVFEDSSEFPFPGPYGAHSDLLDVLKQQYLDNASFFSQGMVFNTSKSRSLTLIRSSMDTIHLHRPYVVLESRQRVVRISRSRRPSVARQWNDRTGQDSSPQCNSWTT